LNFFEWLGFTGHITH